MFKSVEASQVAPPAARSFSLCALEFGGETAHHVCAGLCPAGPIEPVSTVTAPPPPPPLAPAPAPGPMPPEPPRNRWWLTWRYLVAGCSVIAISGGATAAIALNEVSRLTEALKQNKPVKVAPHVLAPTSRGEPETLLLVGNDERSAPKENPSAGPVLPHSNEMLLVRIDPSEPTISMLSIPRELKVPIDKPDGEVEENRINAAYTYGWENGGGTAGGVKLMVETIKRVLGLPAINHVFITNFHKFAKAVNAMGCVYMTVDKRYYHVNEPGGEQYYEINLEPGYQKLCGLEALEFVANRHESTSLIRDARDQRFLLEAKAQYGASLLGNREKFERIFGKYVENTLTSEEEVLQLLYLLIESAGKPVRQVPFHVNLEPTFDSATPEQIHEAVGSFLTGTAPIAANKVNVPTHVTHHHHQTSAAPVINPGFALTPTTAEELQEARAQAPNLPFPLEYPRARDSYGGAEPDELRLYHIHDLHGRLHPIYTIVIDRGELGQYYDVQGTNWTNPPLLNHPGQTLRIGSRTYELVYTGEHVKTIAWHEDGAVYWIENTLTDNVSPYVMLAMAQQTLPVIQVARRPAASITSPTPSNIVLSPHANSEANETSLKSKIAAGLGFVGLAIVAAMSLLVIPRHRRLRGLREQIAQALTLETQQYRLLTASGPANPARAVPVSPRPAPAATGPAPAVLGQAPGMHGVSVSNAVPTPAAAPAASPAAPATSPATPAASPAAPATSPATPAASPATPAASPATPATGPAAVTPAGAQPPAAPREKGQE
jgi:polyisoprenyl-teichoic acid--peptidoglycan teichoic acid transferase